MLEGYALIARRDRQYGRHGGGIAAFAASAIAERVILIQSSEDADRFWFMVHADQGPHLVGVWYRSHASGETAAVTTFKAEYVALEFVSWKHHSWRFEVSSLVNVFQPQPHKRH